ncbi:DUF429 domain-containing protein [Haloglomus halophilum]|uniref:DUF429 domain-containing protein n=1 Tax=Haloglomus halophilum TaxID=2962672 RepID=UPI0020C9DE68|nr:DUF429 domain-containing protein [Haloglomus halophilum]
MRVHGVDFSGSAEPGDDIWIVSGWCPDGERPDTPEGERGGSHRARDDIDLRVTDAHPASEAFGVTGREPVLHDLREFIAGAAGAATARQVTGLDCSFGLPRAVLPAAVTASDDWRATLDWVRETFAADDARSFQSALKERARASDAEGVELKRATDGPTGASSPYSFITRYQTLHGLREVLWPLVERDAVAVPPMATRNDEHPSLVEVYPAGTLRDLGLPDRKYKDDPTYPEAPARRERILDGLLDRGVRLDGVPRERLLADSGGDALDALVGAVAVARNRAAGFAVDDGRYDPVEGYIYV